MLHLNSSCIPDFENIKDLLKNKDYHGVKENRDIKKFFEDISLAFKDFGNSLKTIHNNGNTIISNIHKNSNDDNKFENLYFSKCFLNVISLIQIFSEENLALSEQIQKKIVNKLEEEENERVECINSIYKEHEKKKDVEKCTDTVSINNKDDHVENKKKRPKNEDNKIESTNTNSENITKPANLGQDQSNEIFIDNIPLNTFEIELKKCLENNEFSNRYLNHIKYKRHFLELNRLNINLDKEITAFKELTQKFGKNVNKLLMTKSKERILAIQNKKKSIFEFLYDDIKELKEQKLRLKGIEIDTPQSGDKEDTQNEEPSKDDAHATSNENPIEKEENEKEKNESATKKENLYLEKFEIREKCRIEILYSSIRTFIKLLSLKHIDMNILLLEKSDHISSYDSFVDYQNWLSCVLNKGIDVDNLQTKIKKYDILTKDEQYMLYPYKKPSSSNNSKTVKKTSQKEKKKSIASSNFRKGELMDSENISLNKQKENLEEKEQIEQKTIQTDQQNYKQKKDKKKRANSRRDCQFPDKFYIPIIIKKKYTKLETIDYINEHDHIKNEKNMHKQGENEEKKRTHMDVHIKTYLNDNKIDSEKNIITFFKNRQKNYEKYLLQFSNVGEGYFTRKWHWGINNQINSGSESESESENENDNFINTSENALEDITHFRGYFHEEAHYMYPFKFPKGITSISHFNNTLNNLYTNSLDFGEDDINENDYKLLAYESILLVYYSLCSQLNMCLFFDDNKKSNVTSQLYKRFHKKCSHLLPTLEWNEKENTMDKPTKNMNKINASKYYTKIRKIGNNNNEPKQVKDNNNTSPNFSSFYNNEKKTDEFFQYISYIENVKMENILLIKRILTIFRIKLNLDSRTNNLITLFTLPNYYLNNGHTYSFHILDIRFRIVRIIDTLDLKYTSDINIKETRTSNFRRTNSSSNNTNTDYTIYGEWIKRQLHIFYISLYLKFNRFIKFIPYFNFSYYPYNVNNIFNEFKQNEEYFSYLNKSTENNNFVKYIKQVQKKIQKIHNYILLKKRENNSEQMGRDKKDDLQTNFIDFKSLEKDEKIIFISNLLLKNFVKSFRIVFELKSILKQNEWNIGKYDEKMKLSNMIKYFTKIEYYDYEIRNIFSQCIDIDKEGETINKIDRYDQEINESNINSNMASHSNKNSSFDFGSPSTKVDKNNSSNSNLFNYDKLIKTIFEKELKESDNIRNAKFMGNSIQSFSSITTSKHLKSKSLNTENKYFIKSNNILKNKLSKQLKNKIFYKLNLETVLLSSWFMDRNLLHFFLYFYMSCVIDKNSEMNMYSDAPYIIQGIFFIMYYLQTGNDITLKPKNQAYENGNESTLIPMSSFILYFFIHLFYSFLDKNMLTILPNEELNGNIELFLNPQNMHKKNEQISKTNNTNIGDPKKKTQNIITLQIATKFYYSLKYFHKLLFYRTIDDSILEKCDESIDLNNLESYISNYGHTNNKDNMKKGFSNKLSYEDMARMSKNAKKGNRFSASGISGEMYKNFEIKKKKKKIFRKSSKKDNLVTQVLNLNDIFEKLLIENYVKKQKQINDMIYLKRYRNILLYYNYYNFENLASPYIPNTLSFYMNNKLYSFDHFFLNSILLNYENNENNHNYLFDYNSYKKKTKKNPLIDNYSSLENIQSYRESVCVDNIMNSHKKNENFNPDYLNNDCNFSLINITRIEKIISDITIMKMISCDFRNYLILILSNYRKFIDMYSLSYILEMFLVIHTFFEINKNKKNDDEKKGDSLKISQKSIANTNSKGIEKHTTTIPNSNSNIKFQNNGPIKSVNFESCQFNQEFLTQCEIENYFKFFIYNSVKNIFYNIFSTTKNEIEMKEAKKAAEENKKKLRAEMLSSKSKQADINPFDNSANTKKDNKNNNEQSVDKNKLDVTNQNMENEEEEKTPLIYELVYNQFGDMVNKYINEIVMEILFFSKIWKEYLSLDEHPLTVLYGANKTLYHEILKFLKYNNQNTDFLFNQTLSIIVSLYNFNLINKEIIIQTNCYQKYRALIRNNYQYYSNPKEDGNENNGTDTINSETQQSDQNKTINQFKSITKQPTSKMEDKIMNYYENQSSLVNNSIQIDNENKNNKAATKEENTEINNDENKEDIFISLSLIISNSNNPCMVKLMFKLEKIFIQIIDKRLKHTKKLLYECSKNEKLVPLNSPDIIYNSTCVDIFSIILNILEILFQYKCPIEWIMIPFLDFLNNFIIEYCENYKKKYSSFIISLLNQYADNYFTNLLNITERQKIKWDKYISIGKKKKIQKNMNTNSNTNKDLNTFPDIFKKNELDILNNKKESVLFDENLEQEFSDINEVTKRIKHKKKKKNILYNLFNYEGLDVNKIKHKVGEILDDINEFSNLSTLYHGTNTSNKKLDSEKKTAEKIEEKASEEEASEEKASEENEDGGKKLFSEDLINIIEEINYFFDDSDMSESLVLIWNISFFMNQITEIRKKIERYILKYICTRTESVEKISKIFNNYIDFNINTETLQKNYYTKTLLGVLDTSIDNIKNNLNNFLYHVFKVLSIRIICYEFQQEIIYNLYRPFHINNLSSIVSIFPDTIEKFFIQLPNKFFKNMLTIFIELLIKIWILIIIEKGFSATFEFKDRHIHIMKNDNLLLKKYIQNNQIKLSHTFLTKKYDINEYIDAFFDALYANRNMFSDISAEKSKNKK
ncbi:conserved Plasmodium protein, unknown function [Plasmodium chabaudi chabaudi]|uniref:Uncharacterized protein n=1 Tax=Plasmodium chabaudi chabaudi TaxID=31271 RepID=A0A4V0KC08_PLACU|nr:conserved Plasmodium protein, unknown function [Plasmodium chabaudi chabaudi]VTZ70621.1 conserved Plasmodium protein, unknown function [Plasmodium chabaudi chabaudi]|eukprot:XP_741194.2 conserved Plasmodium protein, unknown function [Plasmodium chabaudi chabaudi]